MFQNGTDKRQNSNVIVVLCDVLFFFNFTKIAQGYFTFFVFKMSEPTTLNCLDVQSCAGQHPRRLGRLRRLRQTL